MIAIDDAIAYAKLTGRAFLGTTTAGSFRFREPNGEESVLVPGALPELLRVARAQRDSERRKSLEKMRNEAQFMAAAGRRVSSRRLVKALERALDGEA